MCMTTFLRDGPNPALHDTFFRRHRVFYSCVSWGCRLRPRFILRIKTTSVTWLSNLRWAPYDSRYLFVDSQTFNFFPDSALAKLD